MHATTMHATTMRSKPWAVGQIQPASRFCKHTFMGTQHGHSLLYCPWRLPMQDGAVATEANEAAKPEIVTFWSFA